MYFYISVEIIGFALSHQVVLPTIVSLLPDLINKLQTIDHKKLKYMNLINGNHNQPQPYSRKHMNANTVNNSLCNEAQRQHIRDK